MSKQYEWAKIAMEFYTYDATRGMRGATVPGNDININDIGFYVFTADACREISRLRRELEVLRAQLAGLKETP